MPPKHHKPSTTKKVVKAAKAVKNAKAAIKKISGHGDYRPTQFQRVRGKGDYFGDLLGKAGGFLGNKVGNWLQGGFRKLTGFGDYRSNGPRSNSLYAHPKRNSESASSSSGPDESSFTMGACAVKFAGKAPRVQHREYIGPILSPGSGFNTKVYRIQPGMAGVDVLFPWGSSVAGCFQQYVMHGCIFEYVSTSSDFATNSALGAVMMSTVYDAEATPLSSVLEVDNNEYTTTAKPSVSFYHPIECASKDNPTTVRYIRKTNTSTTGSDDRLDDVGIFQISTNGLSAAAGTQIGELWVTYDIELLKSALPDVHAGTTSSFKGTMGASGVGSITGGSGGSSAPNPLNSLPVVISQTATTGLRVNMPVSYNGNYLLTLTTVAQAAGTYTGLTLSVSYGADITPLNLFPTNVAGTYMNNSMIVSGGACSYEFAFSTIAATSAGNLLTITNAGTFALSNFVLTINALDNDISRTPESLERAAKKGDIAALLELLKQNSLYQDSSSSSPASIPPSLGSLPPPPSSAASVIEDYEEEKWVDQDTPRPMGTPSDRPNTHPDNTLQQARALGLKTDNEDLEGSVYLPRGMLNKLLSK